MKRPEETTCQWCGLMHKATCPRVSAIEYHQDGTIKRVEFHAALTSTLPMTFAANPAATGTALGPSLDYRIVKGGGIPIPGE
jgi:hypothetical protein